MRQTSAPHEVTLFRRTDDVASLRGGFGARPAASRGVSLLELVVALAIVALVATLIAPVLAGFVRNNQADATKTQEQQIYAAIFGDPQKGTFGFLGDIGRLPATLSELVSQGTLPGFSAAPGGVANVGNMGYGWQGPYLRSFVSNTDWTLDAWGQPFSWSTTGANAGQIVSGGADGTVGTADDIVFPSSPPPTTAALIVVVVANGIANPFGAAAKVYYPANGVQTAITMQSNDPNASGPVFEGFVFNNIPAGVRAVILNHTDNGCPGCGTDARTVPVNIIAGQTNLLEVRMTTQCQVNVQGTLSCAVPAITP